MEEGIIVKLYISKWKSTNKLSLDKLGLRLNNDSINLVKDCPILSQEKLLPIKIIRGLDCAEMKSRIILNKYSFDTLWGKFVPFKAFDYWEKENNEIKEEYLKIAKSIYNNYDEIILTIKEESRKMAKEYWARLYPNQGIPTESFIENYASNVIEQIPSKNDLYASFKYSHMYFTIPMPSLTKNIKENINNSKKRVLEEYLNKRQELIDNFLDSTVIKLRNDISNMCEEIISKNQKNKTIGKNQINKAKAMVIDFDLLNFYNDYEIKNLSSELEIEINKLATERDKNIILEKLNKISKINKRDFMPFISEQV
jgi:hypothetical protein